MPKHRFLTLVLDVNYQRICKTRQYHTPTSQDLPLLRKDEIDLLGSLETNREVDFIN